MKLTRWEVFFSTTGHTFCIVPFAWLARLIAHTFHERVQGGLDYAPEGEGWV